MTGGAFLMIKRNNMFRLLLLVLTSIIAVSLVACSGSSGGGNQQASAPQERVYDIVNPNEQFEGLTKEERHQLLQDNIIEATDGVFPTLELPDGYEFTYGHIEHNLNIHKYIAEANQVTLEIGKIADYTIDDSVIQNKTRHFNTQNRWLWMYGPYESTETSIRLLLLYDDPILNRHLNPMSYNHPIEISTVLDDKPVLIYPHREGGHTVYEWQAVGDHRFRLVVPNDKVSDFDYESFIISTFID